MAALTENDRVECWIQHMTENLEDIGITKSELRSAINATDEWIDDNAASYNSSIPQPARGAMTEKQKTLMFMIVASKRFGVS